MAIPVNFSRGFTPLMHYLKKMKLELTCPTCSDLLRVPTLLPCNHIFCRQCIKIRDKQRCYCPTCGSSYPCRDLMHSIHLESLVNIFKSMGITLSAVVKSLDSQGMKVDSKIISILDHINAEGKLEVSQVFASGHNNTSEKLPSSPNTPTGVKLPVAGTNGSYHYENQLDISGANAPLEESPIASYSSRMTLQVEEGCDIIGRKLTSSACTSRTKVRGASIELGTFGSRSGQSFMKSPMSISLKNDMEAKMVEKTVEILLPCKENLAPQLDEGKTRELKRQKLNIAHDIRLEIEEIRTEVISSTSQIDHSNLLETMTAMGISTEWLLCGSNLSIPQEDLLDKFVKLTGASVSRTWKKNVTHVIGSVDRHCTCRSSKKVLMAILIGQWVVDIDWLRACLEARHPVPEEPFEINHVTRHTVPKELHEISQFTTEMHVCSNGPKKGRLRAKAKAPKIFDGLCFYFGNQFTDIDRIYYEELVLAAGGVILKERDLVQKGSNRLLSYVVYNEDPPQTNNEQQLIEVANKRCDEVASLTEKVTGFKVIGHLWLLDTIAACNSANELAKGASVIIS